MTGGQCNPLFDLAALKTADHATAPQDQGMHPQLGCSSAGVHLLRVSYRRRMELVPA